MGHRHFEPVVRQFPQAHERQQRRVKVHDANGRKIGERQTAAVSLDLNFIPDIEIFQHIRGKVKQNMVDAAMLAGDPAGFSLRLPGHDPGRVAHAGKEIERPVRAGLALELGEVRDAHPRFHMVGEQTAGRIADAHVVRDAAHARIDVGMAVRIDAVRVDAAERRGDFADHRLAHQLMDICFQHVRSSGIADFGMRIADLTAATSYELSAMSHEPSNIKH